MTAPHMPMMNDEKLLTCPFCNGHPEINETRCGYYISCEDCNAETDVWVKLDTAMKKWNTRNGHLYAAEDFNQAAEDRDYGL